MWCTQNRNGSSVCHREPSGDVWMIGSRILPPYGDTSRVRNERAGPTRLAGIIRTPFPRGRMSGTFISYRREDAAGYAGRLRESLERRLGPSRVFRDVDTLRPGQDFVQAIEARLTDCRVMLTVIGREWAGARDMTGSRRLDEPYDFVRLEIAAALARPNVLVVPVLVEGAAMPAASELPENIRPLARRHAVTIRDETWDADVDRLVGVIESATGAVDPSRADAPISPARLWAGGALAVVIVGLLLFNQNRNRDGADPGSEPGAGVAAPSGGGAASSSTPGPPASGA